MSSITHVWFSAGSTGMWRITANRAVIGEGLPGAACLDISDRQPDRASATGWQLQGVVSHPRYATEKELGELRAVSPPLGRPEARCAALIPIRKSSEWWALGQDRRRAIFEEVSRHTARSMKYLPAIARRLHHSRDLGEPFDFLTWFEYTPTHADAFEDLVADLRSSEEWRYVIREVDIRLFWPQ